MIERLFPQDWDFGGEERREMAQKVDKIQEILSEKLEAEDRNLLNQLFDSLIQASNAEIKSAFERGFWDGMELMLEYYRHQRSS